MRTTTNQFLEAIKDLSMSIWELVIFAACLGSVTTLLIFVWIVTNPCAGEKILC